uniref:RING-type domain-containing protein n=1 Tax=Globisporangium ultimum (strain ATCC 200006 / CBS 805.95 / DAOM BR144) TaxID=431595 RepID=K3WGG7_GLOUD
MSASLAAGERDAGARPDDNGDEQEGSAHEIIEVGDDDEEEDAEDGAQNDEDADDDAAVDDVEADACCICQDIVELLAQGFLPSCEHKFHFECIVTWSKVTNLCPLCKQKFNTVTRVDANGSIIHTEKVEDAKQVFRPDPRDHDIAAQLRLVNEARCETCGRGDDEHVLLMCEARGCPISNHTYCIGLSEVPASSWYCSRHTDMLRASDLIERPATTVSSRRTTRRLASLMSNILRGSNRSSSGTATRRGRGSSITSSGERGGRGRRATARVTLESESGRPIRGVAAVYAMRMSRELQQIQQRADVMYARGDHYQHAPSNRQIALSRSTVPAHSSVDLMWQDHDSSRQAMATVPSSTLISSMGSPQPSSTNRISRTLAPEYRALAQLMVDAVASDNYASTVSLVIPKTAKLRLVSKVKTFFARLNDREKLAVLDMECLPVLYKWIQKADASAAASPHPQVLAAVLTVVESLPVRKSDLIEVPDFRSTLNEIVTFPNISVELRERAIKISEKWREINPPPRSASPPRRPQYRPTPFDTGRTPALPPPIRSFSAQKQPMRREKKEKTRKQDAWATPAVEYVKAKLYPLYKHGNGKLTKERFKVIVKQVLDLFKVEAASLQSELVLPSGELTNITKSRLKTLIDRVYKASSNGISTSASSSRSAASASSSSSYSALPPTKHRRIS